MSVSSPIFNPTVGFSAEFRENRWVAVNDGTQNVEMLPNGTPVPVLISDELDSGTINDGSTGTILQIIIHNYS
ncbi:hypothetical protein KBD69_00865 [Candidatus Woesebacteria bacterium]|nr:hypothetical protein [Candidatus Woesebacteria bacterium]